MLKWFKPKINVVRFANGSYGVRVGNSYVDISNTKFRWGKGEQYFKDCQGTEEQAMSVYEALTVKDKIIC